MNSDSILKRLLATRGTPVAVACLITLLAAACSTTLDGAFPDGRHLARTAAEWAGITITRDGRRIAPEKYLTLQQGDRIQTDPRTYALIRFESGTEAYLAPNSGGRVGSLLEFFGEVLAKVRGSFEVQTEYITAAAKGTAFVVRATRDGQAEVIALEGVTRVSSNAGQWRAIELRPGQKARISQAQQPLQSEATPAELDDINNRYRPLEEAAPISKGAAAGTGVAITTAVGLIIHHQTKDKDSKPTNRQPDGQTHEPTYDQPAPSNDGAIDATPVLPRIQ